MLIALEFRGVVKMHVSKLFNFLSQDIVFHESGVEIFPLSE